MFKNYKDCLFNNKTILKSQQRLKSDHNDIYTEEVNKIALSSGDELMNSENSKTSEPYVLILQLNDKLDLKIGEKSIVL